MASIIQLCNVSRAQLQPRLATNPMKLRHQLVQAALATFTALCRVTPDARCIIYAQGRALQRAES
eukprot:5150888-Prymnesium_polylepis.1